MTKKVPITAKGAEKLREELLRLKTVDRPRIIQAIAEARAHVVDVTTLTANGKVVFGCTVELMDEDSEESIVYQIVGEDEADIKVGMISINSPIARALENGRPFGSIFRRG